MSAAPTPSGNAALRDRALRLAPPLLALGAALSLLLALFDLVPAREPAAVASVKFDAKAAVDPIRVPARAASAAPAHRSSLWSFPLCDAPASGARLERLALRADRDSFAVWCRGEYLLLEVDAEANAPKLTRLGRFSARAELPGGAAALDLDRDGALDLVLAVAPAPGVVHRAFSGVFWLRGRAQGGYEPPRALAETPTVALAALELDGAPGGELALLTRGDPAAQRPGELWIFAGGASPSRAAVVPIALAPSELALEPEREGERALWVVSTQPGSLLRLRFARDAARWASPERDELALRGAQSFVRAPHADRTLYVRDLSHVYALDTAPAPALERWLEQVELGPAAWLAGEGERAPALLAATSRGLAWFTPGARAPRERSLPNGVQVRDLSGLARGRSRSGAVLLLESEQPAQLALVVLPATLRDETSEIELRSGALEVAPSEPRVALE